MKRLVVTLATALIVLTVGLAVAATWTAGLDTSTELGITALIIGAAAFILTMAATEL